MNEIGGGPKSSSKAIWIIFFGYIIFVYNKKCLVHLFQDLIRDCNLAQQDVGLISSSQQMSISLVTFLGGILTDYISARILFPFGLIICGLTTLLFPQGSDVNYFSLIWFLNGIGHGLELPTALHLTKQLSSVDSFATNWSLVLTAVNLAGIINPMMTTYLCSNFGWKTTVYVSGTITLAAGISIYGMLNNPGQNMTVQRLTVENAKKTKTKKQNNSFGLFLAFPALWIVVINRFIVGLCRVSIHDWTQLYFGQELNLNQYYSSVFVTAFETSSIFGKILAGRINDYFIAKKTQGKPSVSTMVIRLPIAMCLHLATVLALILYCQLLDSTSSILMCIFIATTLGISSSGNVVTLSILSTEISENKHQGLVTSICNLSTKIGVFVSGYPFTMLALWLGWQGGYTIMVALLVFILIMDSFYYYYCLLSQKMTKDC